jgi:hypothetical protein
MTSSLSLLCEVCLDFEAAFQEKNKPCQVKKERRFLEIKTQLATL